MVKTKSYLNSMELFKYCIKYTPDELILLLLIALKKCCRLRVIMGNHKSSEIFHHLFYSLDLNHCNQYCRHLKNICYIKDWFAKSIKLNDEQSYERGLLTRKANILKKQAKEQWETFLPYMFWCCSKRFRRGIYL